jgi:Flp pilus assembly protein TadG
MLAIVGGALLVSVLIVDIGGYLAARLHAAAAADAVALAAAPATFPRANDRDTPTEAARRIAAANDVRVIACRCAVDASWATRRVEVVVAREVELVMLGRHEVRAIGAAEFSPTAVVLSDTGDGPETSS